MEKFIIQINSEKTNVNDIDPEAIKQFIIESSYVINKKIMDLETKYNVNIKLPPLPKRIPTVRKSSGAIYPTMGVAHINTGIKGTMVYPTQLNINPLIAYGPFLLDPINGMSGENYRERLNKIDQYLKVYQTVKPQLEAWDKATSDPEKADAKAKINSRYVEFLPDEIVLSKSETDVDEEYIENWLASFYKRPGKPETKSTPPPTLEEQVEEIVKDAEAAVAGIEELVTNWASKSPEEKTKAKETPLKIANDKKSVISSKMEELSKLIKDNPTSDAKIDKENLSINNLISRLNDANDKLDEPITKLSGLTGGMRSKYSRYYR